MTATRIPALDDREGATSVVQLLAAAILAGDLDSAIEDLDPAAVAGLAHAAVSGPRAVTRPKMTSWEIVDVGTRAADLVEFAILFHAEQDTSTLHVLTRHDLGRWRVTKILGVERTAGTMRSEP